jgi:hypothetical protein
MTNLLFDKVELDYKDKTIVKNATDENSIKLHTAPGR